IAPVRTVTKTRAEERCAILIDLATGLGRALRLEYIVPGHRHNIFEDIGCLGETYETPLAVVLFHLPLARPLRLLSIKSIYHSRSQFRLFLSTSAHANLNLNRYLRLMALAATDLLLTVPLATFVLCSNVAVTGLSPWLSWADTHSNFSRVVQVPGIYWCVDPYSVETLRWATVAGALFFACLGFADEAIKSYCRAFHYVARRVGYTMAGSGSGMGSTGCVSRPSLFSSC
ncbi:GPCR fungal pheromone mating factor, partial [Mycena leptocephala]